MKKSVLSLVMFVVAVCYATAQNAQGYYQKAAQYEQEAQQYEKQAAEMMRKAESVDYSKSTYTSYVNQANYYRQLAGESRRNAQELKKQGDEATKTEQKKL